MGKTFFKILLATLSFLSFAGCEGKEDNPSSGGGLVELKATLATYVAPSGTQVPKWKNSSQIVVFDMKSGKSATSKAAMAEMTSSDFTMKIEAIAPGDECIAATPAAKMSIVGGRNLKTVIPAQQDGTEGEALLAGKFTHSKSDKVTLNALMSYLSVNIADDNFSVQKVEVKTVSANDRIAGDAVYSDDLSVASCTESTITVVPATPVSCANGGASIPVMIAPGTVKDGIALSITVSTGEVINDTIQGPVELKAGSVLNVGAKSQNTGRALLACGSNKVYLIKTDYLNWGDTYTKGLRWSWDCTSIKSTVAGCKADSHIDDVVLCNDKKQILVTCSNNSGWCVLLEPDFNVDGKATLLFWTNKATNAHSAELLPGGYVAVACSTGGGDGIQLYKIGDNNDVKANYPLGSAHGAVWNEASQRLYAIGGNSLQIYTWDRKEGKLELEKTINTASYSTGLHDIALVDDNTLIMGSSKCAIYKIRENTFQQVTWFNNGRTNGIKSLNYNPATSELFYTYSVAATQEGNYDWSTQTIRYTDTPFKEYDLTLEKQIKVPDIDMYKVRVLNW